MSQGSHTKCPTWCGPFFLRQIKQQEHGCWPIDSPACICFKMLHIWLFLPIGWASSSVCLPRESTVSPTWGTGRSTEPPTPTPDQCPLWLQNSIHGKSPTCLFRGDRLGVGPSSLGQRQLTGGLEEEHRTGLLIPETQRSWEVVGIQRSSHRKHEGRGELD